VRSASASSAPIESGLAGFIGATYAAEAGFLWAPFDVAAACNVRVDAAAPFFDLRRSIVFFIAFVAFMAFMAFMAFGYFCTAIFIAILAICEMV
jgi:hypothetical protein